MKLDDFDFDNLTLDDAELLHNQGLIIEINDGHVIGIKEEAVE